MTISGPARQAASAVLMVRPAAFGPNSQTAATNRFQARSPQAGEPPAARAVAEFDAVAAGLESAGIDVHIVEDRTVPRCPDAVFPNNWVSFHHDGTVVLYPMLAPNRRMERRVHRLHDVIAAGGFRVRRLLDLTHHELERRYLEGTGSVVFDHAQRVAYACRSPRTDLTVLDELCAELDYRPLVFDASDHEGVPVYHTNVMLAIGRRFVVACLDAVSPGDRDPVRASLAASGRTLLEIGHEAMGAFAGNVLELGTGEAGGVLAASQSAADALRRQHGATLDACVGRWCITPVPTIECYGGGSVRCMIAEIFLPRAGAPTAQRRGP